MSWRPVPESRRWRTRRYVRDTCDWIECGFVDLKIGDLFRQTAPDGSPADPDADELEDDPTLVMRLATDVVENYEIGEGYIAEVDVGPLGQLLAGSTN